jgi:hypothetical protein
MAEVITMGSGRIHNGKVTPSKSPIKKLDKYSPQKSPAVSVLTNCDKEIVYENSDETKYNAPSKESLKNNIQTFALKWNSIQHIPLLPKPENIKHRNLFKSAVANSTGTHEILVLGSKGSGTSSLVAKYIGSRLPTKGPSKRVSMIDSSYVSVSVYIVNFRKDLTETRVRNASSVMIASDYTDSGINDAIQWKDAFNAKRLELNLFPINCVFAATKCDKLNSFQKPSLDIESLAVNNFEKVIKVSALTGLNVETAFHYNLVQSQETTLVDPAINVQPIIQPVTTLPTTSNRSRIFSFKHCVVF